MQIAIQFIYFVHTNNSTIMIDNNKDKPNDSDLFDQIKPPYRMSVVNLLIVAFACTVAAIASCIGTAQVIYYIYEYLKK